MSFERATLHVESIRCNTRGCDNTFTAFFPETTTKQLENYARVQGWTVGGYTVKNEQDWYHGVHIPQHACPQHELEEWLKPKKVQEK